MHLISSFFSLKVSDSPAQSVVQHLRWIMQKDLLGQDVFLIGPPGPLRRSIAMQYLVSSQFLCIPKGLNIDKLCWKISQNLEFIKIVIHSALQAPQIVNGLYIKLTK